MKASSETRDDPLPAVIHGALTSHTLLQLYHNIPHEQFYYRPFGDQDMERKRNHKLSSPDRELLRTNHARTKESIFS